MRPVIIMADAQFQRSGYHANTVNRSRIAAAKQLPKKKPDARSEGKPTLPLEHIDVPAKSDAPKIEQFTVINGKNIPNELYTEPKVFFHDHLY
jgi:hypothetical protein